MFARLQTLVVVALAASAFAAPTSRTTVNGSNNFNNGSLQNGNNVDFSIGGASDISGVYNVGAGNSMNIDHSSIAGNNKVTKVTKTTSHHKRTSASTNVNGNNNFNSGSLQNGDNVSFGIYDASDVSGVYNVGSGNHMNIDHSSISGNKKVIQKTVKTAGHHKRHGSSSSSTTVNGSNNFNSGDLQNGNNVDFSIGGASDISGVYNVGSGNSMNIEHSSVSGNTKVTKVTKVKTASHHKRHGSTSTSTVNGSNNANSGDLQNGNNADFAIGNASGISGVYNVGSSNSLNVGHSSIAGNANTKKVTVTKPNSHHY